MRWRCLFPLHRGPVCTENFINTARGTAAPAASKKPCKKPLPSRNENSKRSVNRSISTPKARLDRLVGTTQEPPTSESPVTRELFGDLMPCTLLTQRRRYFEGRGDSCRL